MQECWMSIPSLWSLGLDTVFRLTGEDTVHPCCSPVNGLFRLGNLKTEYLHLVPTINPISTVF